MKAHPNPKNAIHTGPTECPALPETKKNGMALVIALAAVVLLTVLVLAFFSRALLNRQIAFSSTNMIKTGQLADSAADLILGELRQEIADGSVVPDATNNLSTNGITVFQPLAKTNMVPAKMGRDPALASTNVGYTTIMKVSAADTAIRPGGTVKASDIKTSDASQNGRTLSASRWFGASGPNLGSQAILPTWLYVTRDNGVKTPTVAGAGNKAGGDYVIGRFAYTVYDVSGRLDANVAGYPSAAAALAGDKTSAALIDLSKVNAAFTSGASGTIDRFISWRNGADAASEAAYSSYLNGFAATNGFLAVKSTQNAFLSRRDLLNATADGIFPGAAGLFTHTSRFSQSPSWGPTANAPAIPNYTSVGAPMNYFDDANKADSSNRFFPNVRHPANATVTHYADDGTQQTYEVKPGDPLVQRRFSLARLAWFTPSGPQSGKAAAIEACFGLRWDSSKWRWEYIAGKNPPGVRIKTLQEVAQEGREPNFFEFLNAGILSGSLGRDPGKGFFNSVNAGTGIYSSFFDNYKTERNLQILTIGANLIDQYDTDSYPTAIRFDAFGMTGADDLSVQTVYGQENLPYLHSLISIVLADPAPPGGGATGGLSYWLQPQLWNPSNLPPAALTDYPAKFRAYAYGRVIIKWRRRGISSGGGGQQFTFYGPPTDYDDGNGALGSPGMRGVIYFNNPPDATSPFYDRPMPMKLDLKTSAGNVIVDVANTPPTNYYDSSKWDNLVVDGSGTLAQANPFVGFSTVTDTGYDADATNWIMDAVLLPDASRCAYFSLQYLGPDGSYHPYCFMARMSQSSNENGKYFRANDQGRATGTNTGQGWGPIRMDPRTDRFSCYTAWYGKQNRHRTTANYGNNAFPSSDGSGAGGRGDFGAPYIPGIFSYTPDYTPELPGNASSDGIRPGLWAHNNPLFALSGGQKTYYLDPDGVARYGDGYRQNMASGDGSPLYVGNASVSPGSSITTPGTGSALRRRSVILNRPFRSVGELGYAYRDQPFKTLDLWSPTSGDAALLDIFSLSDAPEVAAGRLNPGSSSPDVLKALLSGTSKNPHLSAKILDAEAQTLAGLLTGSVDVRGNRSELASVLGPIVSGSTGAQAFNTSVAAQAEWANKPSAESPMRALANIAETRTWNLMVDVVVQSGLLSPNASSLRDFQVTGERRCWMFVAIDRYSGKVLHKEIEANDK